MKGRDGTGALNGACLRVKQNKLLLDAKEEGKINRILADERSYHDVHLLNVF